MEKQQKKAFTLVELIIVITILTILAAIWFITYQSYTEDARDSSRITSLKEIYKWIQIYQVRTSKLPYPDEQVTSISNWTSIISSQWYVWSGVLSKIRSSEIIDPKDKLPYTYTINWDWTRFQLLAILENSESIKLNYWFNMTKQTYANNYNDRSTFIIWSLIGVFMDNVTSAPVQETLTWINLSTDNQVYKVVYSNPTSTNSWVLVWSWSNLSTQISLISESNSNSSETSVNTNISCPAGQGYNWSTCIPATSCVSWLLDLTLSNWQTWSCMNLWATTVRDWTTQPTNCWWIATNCNSSLTWIWDYYQWWKNDTSRINWNSRSPYNSWWEPQNDTKWGWSTLDSSTVDWAWTTPSWRRWPCPENRHVPSAKDWQKMCNAITWITCTNAMALNRNTISVLKIPYAWYRLRTNWAYNTQKTNWFYWSSSPTWIKSYIMAFNTANFRPTNLVERAYWLPIRCIKD